MCHGCQNQMQTSNTFYYVENIFVFYLTMLLLTQKYSVESKNFQ